jgi:hypothetical protein
MEPAWKSGPTYEEPTSSEHAISSDNFRLEYADWDGFGRDEEAMVEGDPLVVLMERAECSRDGCDADYRRRLLFTTHTLTDENVILLAALSGAKPMAEYVSEHGERVDEETIEVPINAEAPSKMSTLSVSAERVNDDEPRGDCYGRSEWVPNDDRYKL